MLLVRRPNPRVVAPRARTAVVATTIAALLSLGCGGGGTAVRHAAGGTGAAPRHPRAVDLAITDVAIIDVVAGRTVPGQTVLVAGNRIVAIGAAPELRSFEAARTLDGRGRFLLPGLWDMHVHAHDRELSAPLFTAFGITGIRQMSGTPALRAWRDSVRAGLAHGPRMVVASPMLDGARPLWPQPGASIAVTSASEAARVVDRLAGEDWDLVKVYSKLTPEAYHGIIAAARARGLPVVGHVPELVNAGDASDAGHQSMEHHYGLDLACSSRERELRDSLRLVLARAPDWPTLSAVQSRLSRMAAASHDGEKCEALYRRFARNGTVWVPTLVTARGYTFSGDSAEVAGLSLEYARVDAYWRQGVRPVPPERRAATDARFRASLRQWQRMHRAGVRLLAGTDLGNPMTIAGVSLHAELAWLVEAGLTPADALRAATLHAAQSLDATDSLGTVAVGKIADLVVLDADPLLAIANSRRIHAVVTNGQLTDAAGRAALLAQAARIAATPLGPGR